MTLVIWLIMALVIVTLLIMAFIALAAYADNEHARLEEENKLLRRRLDYAKRH